MTLIDSHCHLDFPDFDTDREAVLQHSQALGVRRFVIPAVTAKHFVRVWAMTQRPQCYVALGLHPQFLAQHQHSDIDILADWLMRHKNHARLCAVGEIGLDFYNVDADRERQQYFLEAQLELAQTHQLPVILHVRRAHAPMIATLKRYQLKRGGIVHAFSGSAEEAREYHKLGFLLGMGGAGTWPQAKRMQRLWPDLPLEQIVLETDAPDMAPAGYSGQRNSPEYLPFICATLAEQRGLSSEVLAAQSTANLEKLLGWSPLPEHQQHG